MTVMAKEFGTDPWTVYHWEAGRFDFNLMCLEAYHEALEEARGKTWSDQPPEWPG